MAASLSPITLAFVGLTGEGKSLFGNFLLKKKSESAMVEHFQVGNEIESCTELVKEASGVLRGFEDRPITILDTPGLDDTEGRDETHLKNIVASLQQYGQINAFVLIMNKFNVFSGSDLFFQLSN